MESTNDKMAKLSIEIPAVLIRLSLPVPEEAKTAVIRTTSRRVAAAATAPTLPELVVVDQEKLRADIVAIRKSVTISCAYDVIHEEIENDKSAVSNTFYDILRRAGGKHTDIVDLQAYINNSPVSKRTIEKFMNAIAMKRTRVVYYIDNVTGQLSDSNSLAGDRRMVDLGLEYMRDRKKKILFDFYATMSIRIVGTVAYSVAQLSMFQWLRERKVIEFIDRHQYHTVTMKKIHTVSTSSSSSESTSPRKITSKRSRIE
jgi:hypothetical protein